MRFLKKMLAQRSLLVDMLAICFGIGTWVAVSGTFLQLPLLVEEAPEGWSLPSYLTVMVQIGNLGPLAYTLMERFAKSKIHDACIIYSSLTVATITALLTAFFYNKTANLFGSEHSVALFILTIFTSLNACTSSVLFMPYMGRFREIYFITYFIGEGLSGLLPSVLALIQGITAPAECILKNVTESGEEIYETYYAPPRFGSQAFFLFVFAMLVCSTVGFTLLDRLKVCKTQYAAVQVSSGNSYVYEKDVDTNTSASASNSSTASEISQHQYIALLLSIGVVSFFSNGIYNSIQSYSCLPYGNQAYHLSATLGAIANPVACFLAVFLPRSSIKSISVLGLLATLLTVWVMLTATMSPHPPLYGTTEGEVLVITVWTLLIGLISYIKLAITTLMRAQGGRSLVWVGGVTQLGSFLGSIIIFFIINYTNRFEAAVVETC